MDRSMDGGINVTLNESRHTCELSLARLLFLLRDRSNKKWINKKQSEGID
jgi:hypothetical protein